MINFSGQRVVITGAAGGVGRALVETFKAYGAEIVAYDVQDADFSNLQIEEIHRFDLTDTDAMRKAAAATCQDKQPPVAIINNAGWTRAETMKDVTPQLLDYELDLNFRAVAALSQEFLPIMRQHGGNFVFISSLNALAHFGNPAYAAAKAGLLAWSRAIATEEGRNNIRSNAIVPGSIRTSAWTDRLEADPALADRLEVLYPLGRFVFPKEVAQTAAFLASSLASGITGVTLPVDAGISAGNLPFFDEISKL